MRTAMTAMFVRCDRLLRGGLAFSPRTQDAEAEAARGERVGPLRSDSSLAGLAVPALRIAHHTPATRCASAWTPQWG
jgi:hypothetical protein